ncbi:MAG: hypothetical protein PHX62_00015 [Bacilli bacterium]|nr:hypothetical protein [Bacilli bacterium]
MESLIKIDKLSKEIDYGLTVLCGYDYRKMRKFLIALMNNYCRKILVV